MKQVVGLLQDGTLAASSHAHGREAGAAMVPAGRFQSDGALRPIRRYTTAISACLSVLTLPRWEIISSTFRQECDRLGDPQGL